MPLTDSVVLLIIGAATSVSAILLWRRMVRGRDLRASVWLSFYGMALIAMMAAHNLEILYRAFVSSTRIPGSVPIYDFRMYSLLLLGLLLAGAGVVCLRAVPGVSRGSAKARETSARASLFVLIIVAPLIPIQRVFGTLLTGLTVVSLLLLARRPRPSMYFLRNEESKPTPAIRA